jgi:hypothetical protein
MFVGDWLCGRCWQRPVEQRATTVIHHAQSISPGWPVSHLGKAPGECQSRGTVDSCDRHCSDDLGNTPSKTLELDQESHASLLNAKLLKEHLRLPSNGFVALT